MALVGCGGGGDDEPATTSSVADVAPTRLQFLVQADQICTSSEAQIEASADELASQKGRPDPDEVSRVALRIAVPALESEVRAIEALGAPKGDEAEVQAILDATEKGIEQIKADPRALADRPPPALREAQKLASAYGSRECGFR